MSSSTVTYTSVYSDSKPWRFQWVLDDELEAPDEAPQCPGQAPPSLDYMPGLEHPPLPDYVPGLEETKHAPLSPDYPLPDDASPIALSSGYVADSDPEEDPKEDPTEYPANGGGDDDDDVDDDKEEEEHLALTDSTTLHAVDHVSSAKDIEAFEIDESAPTPPRSPKLRRARISVLPQTSMAASAKTLR
ncbi:hypothetical protein Tco_0762328 [Tanacetum coccineum]